MGWCQGFEILHEQITNIHDILGQDFTPEICRAIINPFDGEDMDDCDGLGEEIMYIIVDTLCPEFEVIDIDPDPNSMGEDWYNHTEYAYYEKMREYV